MFAIISLLFSVLNILDQPMVSLNLEEPSVSRTVSVSSSQSNRRMTLTPTDTAIIGNLHFQVSKIDYVDLTTSPAPVLQAMSPPMVHPLLKHRQQLQDLTAPGPEFTEWTILTTYVLISN